jgi:hypothetical protein
MRTTFIGLAGPISATVECPVMSAWRRRALESFPELSVAYQIDLQSPQYTIHSLFGDLAARCKDGSETPTDDELRRIYEFAKWAYRQKDFHLSNAAAVSFYENLGGSDRTRDQMRRWVPPDVYHEVRELLEMQLDAKDFAKVDRIYESSRKRKS